MKNFEKKLLKYIILFISFATIFMCDKVYAKNVAMECEYNFVKDSLAGFGGGKVKCTIYTDNTHKCILNPDGEGKQKYVSNWGSKKGGFDAKKYYKENRTCPPILVYYNDTDWPAQIFFADNQTTADKIKNEQSYPERCYYSSNPNDESSKKKYSKKISDHTAYIKEQANSYDFNSCIEKDKTITRVEQCSETIESLTNYINSTESEVNSWISAGYVSNDDEVVKNFKAEVNNARNVIDKANKEIDNEREKIKQELGLENDYKEDNSNAGDTGEKTSGCGIFGEKTLKLVKRIYKTIQFIIPIIVIAFGMLDFIKALVSGEEKEFKKAGSKFAKRVILGICFFLIPAILGLFIRISGITNQYDINDGLESIFCDLEQ